MANAINWFEIPATDIERAAGFYSVVFEAKLEVNEMTPGFKMAQFPAENGEVSGALLQREWTL